LAKARVTRSRSSCSGRTSVSPVLAICESLDQTMSVLPLPTARVHVPHLQCLGDRRRRLARQCALSSLSHLRNGRELSAKGAAAGGGPRLGSRWLAGFIARRSLGGPLRV
jgi:hypothetical protein